MPQQIDLNCDMGEGFDTDASIMPLISSVNIACGAHAGDEETIRKTIGWALQDQVSIGAHPSYPDREGFGRMEMVFSAEEIYKMVTEQVIRVRTITLQMGGQLHHVKPHGALYNAAAKDAVTANAIAKAILDIDPSLILYGLPESASSKAAEALGLKYCNEVFADRTYTDEGQLTPRSRPDALITDEARSLSQVLMMVMENKVRSVSGILMPIKAESICIHGDGAHALAFAKRIRAELVKHQIGIHSPA